MEKEVIEVKLQLDYAFGPIWGQYVDPVEIKLYTGIDVIDNNAEIQELNDKICGLFSSFYDPDQCYDFDYDLARSKKPELVSMINQLIDMLNKVNDGSFVIINKLDRDLNF